MHEYPIKRQNQRIMTDKSALKSIIQEIFGECTEEENCFTTSYGALKLLKIRVNKNQLCVETEMNKDVSEQIGVETRKKYNLLLERVTGYTSKERSKKLQK